MFKSLLSTTSTIGTLLLACVSLYFGASYMTVATFDYNGKPGYMLRGNPYVIQVITPKVNLFGFRLGPVLELNAFTKKPIEW